MAELWAKGRTESEPATRAHGKKHYITMPESVDSTRVIHGLCRQMYSEWHTIVTLADEDDDLDNAYELLGLEDDAGEKEIKADGTSASER
jgi:hypothetical protein